MQQQLQLQQQQQQEQQQQQREQHTHMINILNGIMGHIAQFDWMAANHPKHRH